MEVCCTVTVEQIQVRRREPHRKTSHYSGRSPKMAQDPRERRDARAAYDRASSTTWLRPGGATREADTDGIYILKPDGAALASFAKIRPVEPGDAIIVPISTEPKVRALRLMRDIATILTGFALPFATIVALLEL